MPISPPAPRTIMHLRRVTCEGFLREDGDWDIEGRIIDTKPSGSEHPETGYRPPKTEIHHMVVRLTVDTAFMVKAVEVEMPATPYSECQPAAASYQKLVGRKIGSGWRKAVNEAAGGTEGCTHISELLFPMATVAFQTVRAGDKYKVPQLQFDPDGNPIKPFFLGACKGWALDGAVTARQFPQFAIKPSAE